MRPFIFPVCLLLLASSAYAEQAAYPVEKSAQGRTPENKIQAAPASHGKPADKAGKSKQPVKVSGHGKYYLVKPGETLYSIAVATGIGQQKLAEWNALPASNVVKTGQMLKLFPSPQATARLAVQKPSTGKPQAIESKAEIKNRSVPILPVKKFQLASPASTPIKIIALPDSITVTPLSEENLVKVPPLSSEVNKKAPKPLGVTNKFNNSPVKSPIAKPKAVHAKKVLIDKKAKKPSLQTVKPAPAIALNTPGQTKINSNLKIKKPDISIDNKRMLKLNFQWPIKGIVLKKISKSPVAGVDIASRQDKQKVNAAESGKVVYQGRGLQGYENLVVIKHSEDYVSVYANNSRLLVKDGQQVTKGQAIGEIFAAGGQQKPLHFEIRKNGQAVEALSLLPKR